jgi:hypothetical protein
MPTDEEMMRIYSNLIEVWTPKGRYRNRILAVYGQSLVLQSESPRSKGPREITYDQIRDSCLWNWQIIQSLRAEVRLSNDA